MEAFNVIIIAFSLLFLLVGIFSYWKNFFYKKSVREKEKNTQRKMYELAILKELGDRIGYSLNIQNVVDIITGSLSQFIEYSVVSYILIGPDAVIFKAHLEKSVSRKFINEVKKRMLRSLSVLINKKFKENQVQEVITGAILTEELETKVQSFFNIPLVIGQKVVGVLTVAHTEQGHYQEEEMTILYKITRQASDAITKLQNVVQTEQRKLNAMVSSMSEGVIMTDKDYHIVVVNPAAKKIIESPKNFDELNIFDFIENLGGKFDIRGKLEESVRFDKIIEANDILIKDRFYQIFVSPVKSVIENKTETLGSVAIFHDITKEKEVEKMREDFTSMMVHELRSPLDNIKKMAQYLLDNKKQNAPPADYNEFMPLIKENSSNMLDLVNDLLDAAKIDSGKFEINKTLSNILEIIADRIKFYETSASESKLKFTVLSVPEIPAKIMLDPIKISQALNNLFSNAIKFSRPTGIIRVNVFVKKNQSLEEIISKNKINWYLDKLEIEKISKLPDSLVISVTNPGDGISKNKISDLFSKFVQFQQSAASEKKGTGLGLVITKGIIKAHGGTIGVGSAEGEGATFYFTIPLI